jgi:hypothetical protein
MQTKSKVAGIPFFMGYIKGGYSDPLCTVRPGNLEETGEIES